MLAGNGERDRAGGHPAPAHRLRVAQRRAVVTQPHGPGGHGSGARRDPGGEGHGFADVPTGDRLDSKTVEVRIRPT